MTHKYLLERSVPLMGSSKVRTFTFIFMIMIHEEIEASKRLGLSYTCRFMECRMYRKCRSVESNFLRLRFFWDATTHHQPLLRQWFDLLQRGEHNNFLSVEGFLVALRDTLRIKPGGLLWCGHPCNPFLIF